MEWYDRVEENRDRWAAALDGWSQMPAYLEGQDIIQDVALDILEKGANGAEDIVSVFFTRATQRLLWLIRRERGQAKDHRREFVELSEEMLDHRGTAEQYIARDELVYGLRHLELRDRSVVWSRYIEGFSVKELADELGLSENGVRKIIDKSFSILREIIEQSREELAHE